MAVPPFPGPVREIAAQAREPGVHVGDLRERGDGAADTGVQVRMWSPPVRAEEPIDAVVGYRKGMGLEGPQHPAKLVERRENAPIGTSSAGKYSSTSQKPGARRSHVTSTTRSWATRASSVRPRAVRPVVDGEDGQRRREGGLPKREMRGGRPHDRRAADRALTDHGR